MENGVKDFILKNNLNINNKVICAVSGGADSLSLLYILYNLGYDVVLAHVNHHKRKESEMEEEKMRKLAEKLSIPFEVLEYHFDGVGNFHDKSHQARYDFFRGLCDKYKTDIIATAHQQDDQIETILIKLMEGSNLYGYGGIPLVNYDGKYRIIRPLLCLSKEDLYNYCKKNNIKYYEDSSNHEDDFLRNRIRHHIIPLLKEECSDLYDKALRYSLILHESFSFIRDNSISYLRDHEDSIDLLSFNKLDIALKKDIISLLLEKYDIRRNTNIINDILVFLSDNNGTKTLNLEGGNILIRSYNKAYISTNKLVDNNTYYLNIDESIIFDNKYKFYFSKNIPDFGVKYIKLCYNTLKLPFEIRKRKNGDYINLESGTKKVSRVLVDRKVESIVRDNIPLVFDSNNNLLWIVDYLKSDIVYKMKQNSDIYLICEVVKNA